MNYTEDELKNIRTLITENNIEAVEIAFTDINGELIGKRLPAQFFLKNPAAGTGLCRAPLTWDIQSEYFSTSPFAGFDSGAADMILKPDFPTARIIPYRKNTILILANPETDKGEPINFTPRQILKNILAKYEDSGYELRIGSEIEFYLLDENKRPLFGGKQTYSIKRGGEFSGIIDQLQNGIEGLNIPIEAIHSEYGPGQFEIILEHTEALTQADNATIARNAIKEIARKNGLYATFMALPWSEHSGSGYHFHQSLWKDGDNVFNDENLFSKYASGLLETTREFQALAAPTVNSYKRLADMSFAPTRVGIGFDNRTVSARVVGYGKSKRIESRNGSADANPYLLFAGAAAGGLKGLSDDLPAPDIISGNGYRNENLPEIPRTLTEAAILWDKSIEAANYFGNEFKYIFSELIHFDIRANHSAVSEWERERYL